MNAVWAGAFNGDRMEIKSVDNVENALGEWVNEQSARVADQITFWQKKR